MRESHPESSPHKPSTNPSERMKEEFKLYDRLREMLEFDAANELCKPLYEITEKPPEKQPPFEDTLVRLERIMMPKKPEFQLRLIGGCYPLDLEGTEFLVLLTDGTIFKIKAPDDPHLRSFNEEFANLPSIEKKDLYRKVIRNPISNLAILGILVYRTDDPTLNPEEIKRMVEEDWKRAQELKTELLRRRETNRMTGLRIVTSYPEDPNEPPPSS